MQGTAEAPYWVENAEHLNNVRLFPDAHFIQTADIDTGNDVFKPIGDFDTPFTGHYDGEGHRITVNELGATEGNIKLAGLWGFTSGAEIKNLNVDVYASLKLDGRVCVGGIAGRNTGALNDCKYFAVSGKGLSSFTSLRSFNLFTALSSVSARGALKNH